MTPGSSLSFYFASSRRPTMHCQWTTLDTRVARGCSCVNFTRRQQAPVCGFSSKNLEVGLTEGQTVCSRRSKGPWVRLVAGITSAGKGLTQ